MPLPPNTYSSFVPLEIQTGDDTFAPIQIETGSDVFDDLEIEVGARGITVEIDGVDYSKYVQADWRIRRLLAANPDCSFRLEGYRDEIPLPERDDYSLRNKPVVVRDAATNVELFSGFLDEYSYALMEGPVSVALSLNCVGYRARMTQRSLSQLEGIRIVKLSTAGAQIAALIDLLSNEGFTTRQADITIITNNEAYYKPSKEDMRFTTIETILQRIVSLNNLAYTVTPTKVVRVVPRAVLTSTYALTSDHVSYIEHDQDAQDYKTRNIIRGGKITHVKTFEGRTDGIYQLSGIQSIEPEQSIFDAPIGNNGVLWKWSKDISNRPGGIREPREPIDRRISTLAQIIATDDTPLPLPLATVRAADNRDIETLDVSIDSSSYSKNDSGSISFVWRWSSSTGTIVLQGGSGGGGGGGQNTYNDGLAVLSPGAGYQNGGTGSVGLQNNWYSPAGGAGGASEDYAGGSGGGIVNAPGNPPRHRKGAGAGGGSGYSGGNTTVVKNGVTLGSAAGGSGGGGGGGRAGAIIHGLQITIGDAASDGVGGTGGGAGGAGGGATIGAAGAGGNGNAGETITVSVSNMLPGDVLEITVGAGGAGGKTPGNPISSSANGSAGSAGSITITPTAAFTGMTLTGPELSDHAFDNVGLCVKTNDGTEYAWPLDDFLFHDSSEPYQWDTTALGFDTVSLLQEAIAKLRAGTVTVVLVDTSHNRIDFKNRLVLATDAIEIEVISVESLIVGTVETSVGGDGDDWLWNVSQQELQQKNNIPTNPPSIRVSSIARWVASFRGDDDSTFRIDSVTINEDVVTLTDGNAIAESNINSQTIKGGESIVTKLYTATNIPLNICEGDGVTISLDLYNKIPTITPIVENVPDVWRIDELDIMSEGLDLVYTLRLSRFGTQRQPLKV